MSFGGSFGGGSFRSNNILVFKTGFAPQIVSRAVCTGLASRFDNDIDSSGVERALAKLVAYGRLGAIAQQALHDRRVALPRRLDQRGRASRGLVHVRLRAGV